MTGPTIRDNSSRMRAPEATVAARDSDRARRHQSRWSGLRCAPGRRLLRAHEAVATTTKKPSNVVRSIEVSFSEPELRDRVKAVLDPGSRLELAAADFDNSEQFVTVAHAARNTQVPFIVLKDRVLNRGESLADAIREFKPELDAKAEVTRARAVRDPIWSSRASRLDPRRMHVRLRLTPFDLHVNGRMGNLNSCSTSWTTARRTCCPSLTPCSSTTTWRLQATWSHVTRPISVFAKSSPLKRSGSPDVRANA